MVLYENLDFCCYYFFLLFKKGYGDIYWVVNVYGLAFMFQPENVCFLYIKYMAMTAIVHSLPEPFFPPGHTSTLHIPGFLVVS